MCQHTEPVLEPAPVHQSPVLNSKSSKQRSDLSGADTLHHLGVCVGGVVTSGLELTGNLAVDQHGRVEVACGPPFHGLLEDGLVEDSSVTEVCVRAARAGKYRSREGLKLPVCVRKASIFFQDVVLAQLLTGEKTILACASICYFGDRYSQVEFSRVWLRVDRYANFERLETESWVEVERLVECPQSDILREASSIARNCMRCH